MRYGCTSKPCHTYTVGFINARKKTFLILAQKKYICYWSVVDASTLKTYWQDIVVVPLWVTKVQKGNDWHKKI